MFQIKIQNNELKLTINRKKRERERESERIMKKKIFYNKIESFFH